MGSKKKGKCDDCMRTSHFALLLMIIKVIIIESANLIIHLGTFNYNVGPLPASLRENLFKWLLSFAAGTPAIV